jgi:hypothetical protein
MAKYDFFFFPFLKKDLEKKMHRIQHDISTLNFRNLSNATIFFL